MKKPSPGVTAAARNLARKIEDIRRTNPELAEQLEEWTCRLVAGESLPSVQAEMDAVRDTRGIPRRTTIH
jgi:hypothetical protein